MAETETVATVETKPLLQSKTVLVSIINTICWGLALLGIVISPEDQTEILGMIDSVHAMWLAIVGIGSSLAAIIFRATAKKQIKIGGTSAPASIISTFLLLLYLAVSAWVCSACVATTYSKSATPDKITAYAGTLAAAYAIIYDGFTDPENGDYSIAVRQDWASQ